MLALLALLPLLAVASAAPTSLQKRYTSVKIRSGRNGLCLAAAPKTGVGSAVITEDCNSSNFRWKINPGSGSVTLAVDSNPTLALDAGENPHNNGAVKVWQSYPGLYQQTWYLTDDNRIAITGGDQCLDEGDNGPQTYQCTTGNTNQVWYIDGADDTPTSTSSTQPSATPSSTNDPFPDLPQSTVIPADPASGGRRIRVGGRNDLCVTVQGGYHAIGAVVAISGCFFGDGGFTEEQLWDIPEGPGPITLHGYPELCLDAGDNPGDGSKGMKLYTCYDGLLQQTWDFSNGHLSLANGQCLDIEKESTSSYQKPYNSVKSLQTWSCSAQDPYQQFQLYDGPNVE